MAKGLRYGKPGLLWGLLGTTTNHDNWYHIGLNMIECPAISLSTSIGMLCSHMYIDWHVMQSIQKITLI